MVKTTDFCHGWPKRAQTDFNCCCVWRIILHDAPMIPYYSFGLWPVAVILHPALCFSGWNSFITGLKQNVSERTANTSRCRVSLQYKGLHMHDCCSTASFYESKLFWSRMHHFPPLLSAWSSPGTSILKIQRMLNLQNFKCSLAQISNMAQSCLSLDCPGCSIEYFAPTIPPKIDTLLCKCCQNSESPAPVQATSHPQPARLHESFALQLESPHVTLRIV